MISFCKLHLDNKVNVKNKDRALRLNDIKKQKMHKLTRVYFKINT